MKTSPPTQDITASPISEHGARVAAGILGITVDEYRRHEAADEHWCSWCAYWLPRKAFGPDRNRATGVGSLCRTHRNDQLRRGRRARRQVGVSFAGPRYAPHRRVTPNPEGAGRAYPAPAPSGHEHCPPVLGCHEGRIPVGWVREVKP